MKRKLDAIYLGAAAGESTLMSNLDLHFLISLYFILFERGWRLQTFIFHKTNFHLSLAEKNPTVLLCNQNAPNRQTSFCLPLP